MGGQSSAPALLTALGNSVIFEATDGSTGVEPYLSDGTNAGTFRLADIRSGGQSSNPTEMKGVSALGLVFFDANAAGAIGRQLYKTNGTPAGTVIVADINAGAGNSNPTNLSSALGLLFFSANSGTNGIEPFVSNGTAGRTFELADINAGGSSSPSNIVATPTYVYFTADDNAVTGINAATGIEWWRTDGTVAGTMQVHDIRLVGTDANVQLGGVGTGNGDFVTGDVYTIDRIPPQVANIESINYQYTRDAIVTFAVSFSESVFTPDVDDFAVVANGPVGATVLAVRQIGPADFEVDVNTGSGDGTLQLSVDDDDSIEDAVNQPLGGVGAGNGDFVGAAAYTIDRTPPAVTISAPSPSITRNGPVTNQLLFSGADFVYLNASMITLNTTGTVTGTVNLTGSGNFTRDVTISDITGDGTLSISVSSGAVNDLANNTNAPVGPSAGVDVSSTVSVPVNPWFVAAMMLAVTATWFALATRRKRAQRR